MNKTKWYKTALILLPMLAAALSTTVDSVTVYDSVSGVTRFGSYYSMMDVGMLSVCAPLAGLLTFVVLFFSAAALIMKKYTLIVWAKWAAFASSCLAVLPVILRGETLIVPNVGVPLFMMAEWAVAWYLTKKEHIEPEKLKPGKYSNKKKK